MLFDDFLREDLVVRTERYDKRKGSSGNIPEVRKDVEIRNKIDFARDSLKNQKICKKRKRCERMAIARLKKRNVGNDDVSIGAIDESGDCNEIGVTSKDRHDIVGSDMGKSLKGLGDENRNVTMGMLDKSKISNRYRIQRYREKNIEYVERNRESVKINRRKKFLEDDLFKSKHLAKVRAQLDNDPLYKP